MFSVDRHSVRKILVIKLRAVGDVVLSTIVTKNLRMAFPGAQINYLVEPPGRDIVNANPYINDTLVFNPASMTGAGLIRLVRSLRYDLVIDLFSNPRTALVTWMSGARYRVGYRFRGRAYAYNILVEPRGNLVHNTQFNLDALEALGIDILDRKLYVPYSSDDEMYVFEFLARAFGAGKLVIGINAGGGWYTKRWGLERFAALADILVKRFEAGIILLWGPGQLRDVERIQSLMKHDSFIPPPTTLLQLGALLHHCTLMVTNDSGPMHIAAAVGTPVVAVFGPTNPFLQGPYGEGHVIVRNERLTCLGCNFTDCPIGNPCMLQLSIEEVLNGVELALQNKKVAT